MPTYKSTFRKNDPGIMPKQKPTKNNTKELTTEFFPALLFLFLGNLFLFSVNNPTAMLAAIKVPPWRLASRVSCIFCR